MTTKPDPQSTNLQELERVCREANISRFAPEEIVELLQEGEGVDWILEQILPSADGDTGDRLRAILNEFAFPVSQPKDGGQLESLLGKEPARESEGMPALAAFNLEDLNGLELPAGVDPGQIQQMMESPQGALLADFSRFCEEQGMQPGVEEEGSAKEEEMAEAMQGLHEEWLATPRPALEGKKPADLLPGGRLIPHKVETFRRDQPKIGRNDPCPCGSGKKYKRCCG